MNLQHKNLQYLTLSDKLVKNINILIKESGINQVELAKLAKIPYSTLNGIVTGSSVNPRLYTLSDLARVFNVHISQLIGEIPLNFSEVTIPILEWHDINITTGSIDFHITQDTRFISCALHSTNLLFALRIEANISDRYKDNSILLIERTTNYINNDLVLLSINQSAPIIKKIIKEGNDVYLESISNNIPLQIFHQETAKIFGVIRETRILN